jgi:hypothetical protein
MSTTKRILLLIVAIILLTDRNACVEAYSALTLEKALPVLDCCVY